MKLKNLLTTMALTAAFLVFGQASFGQVTLPHYDGLDYTVGQGLQTQSGWATLNTGDDLAISSGSLSYSGLPASTGNKVIFDGGGIDAAKLFTTQTSGTVYCSFLLNVTSLGSLNTTGGYQIGFIEGTTSSIFGATVWTKSDGIGGFLIGLNPRTTAANTVWSTSKTLNTTYFIVIAYQMVAGATNDVVKMWINPTPGASAPAETLTATNTSTDLADVSRLLIRQGSSTDTPFLQLDEFRIGTSWADVTPAGGADTQAPVLVPANFVPADNATDVAINTTLTIPFDENVQVGTGTISVKKVSDDTEVFAIDVTTGAVSVTGATATVTLPSDLANSTEYYVNISAGAFKDMANNDFAGLTDKTTWSFTTIGATTPTLTLTAPNGGEKYYAGEQATITWTSTNIAAGETITIEVAPDGTTFQALTTSLNDGTEMVTIPSAAEYATTYKIKVSYSTASDESDAAFTVIAVTDNLAALRALPANSIVKYTGKATVTFATSYRNQKFIQDATAAVIIDDNTTAPGFITDTYAIGEGISNIEGKITLYANLVEIVPLSTTGEKVTGNPTITPEVRTIASLTAADQCKLVKVENMSLSATGSFAARTNYDVVGQANTAFVLRSAPDGADYIGTAIPVYPFDLVCLVGQYNAVMQVTPRMVADFDVHIPVYTVTFTVTRNSVAIEGANIAINSQNLTTNVSGVATIDLQNGSYNYSVSKGGYNTNSGSVVVTSAAKAVNVDMWLTGVGTNSFAKLNVYPNPFVNEIRFDGAEIERVTITSIIGQVVVDKTVTGEYSIDTQSLNSGIYLVRFTNNKGESTLRKLVKK